MFPQLVTYFHDKPVTRAYLFGSVARGEQTANSDVDILVELDYSGGANFYQFLTMQEQLPELLGRPVDLISANGLSPFIKPAIDREKQLIYEKGCQGGMTNPVVANSTTFLPLAQSLLAKTVWSRPMESNH